jgi:hypothetical protein
MKYIYLHRNIIACLPMILKWQFKLPPAIYILDYS